MRKLLTFISLLLLGTSGVHASHISGGEIIWDCLGGGDYEFTLVLYRDCDGINMQNTEVLTFTSSCGTQTLTVNLQNPGGDEVSQLCPAEIVNSTCNGGTLPGMQAYYYTGTVNLQPCADWTVDWDDCCRNAAISNLTAPGGLDSYIEATFNNLDYPCDNSARFTAQPIPYVCLNQLVNYSFGAFDPDADSLNYSLIGAREAGATAITYVAPYSPAAPITGASINQFTGLLTFTPTIMGNWVFVVLVEQFDDDGNLIGTVMRDIQFITITCSNVQPNANDGDISNFTGSALQTDSMSIEMCATQNFCFDFTIGDPDAIDTLILTSNVDLVLPGATFTYSGTNPVMGQICWTGLPGSEGLNSFTITANDQACQIPGFQTYVYDVLVLPRTTAGPDQIICGPQLAQLDAMGGSVFTWSVLTGDPIAVGTNFTCNPCSSPIATPANTTTYIVTSNLGGGCLNADTVTVSVVPDFTFAATQSDTTVCLGESVQFDVSTVPVNTGGYVFQWTPSTGLTNPNIANPIGTWNLPGTYSYLVEITSPDSCVKLDTNLTVTVVPAYTPDFDLILADDSICEGASTTAQVVLDNGVPNTCGINFQGCIGGTLVTADIGDSTATNTTTQYPAPYGNFYNGARHQILFRASELNAMGFTAGTITELGWNIDVINGLTNYQNFEIRLACTTQNELTDWITGADVVFPAQDITIAPGWNVHTFQFGFDWDGNSNLIVEVCFDMFGITTFTQNSATFYTTTTYNSVLYYRADGGGVCYGGFPTVSANRPNTRFTFCSGVDSTLISYNWTPANGVSDPASSSPTFTPTSSPATYTVTLGDPNTGCFGTSDITINWYPQPQVSFTPNPPVGVFPLNVNFDNTSGNNVINFDWQFGDFNGTTSTDFSPNFVYDTPGWYYVTLTGTDINGCVGTYLDSLEVLSTPVVEIPNVFSPNGDGNNDSFNFIDFKGFKDWNMKIYNRWGNVVHETKSTNSNLRIWNPGLSDPADGTYFYIFTGVGSNGDEVERSGHVTLLR